MPAILKHTLFILTTANMPAAIDIYNGKNSKKNWIFPAWLNRVFFILYYQPVADAVKKQRSFIANSNSMAFTRCFYVYITTNHHKTVLYTGITNNVCQRLTEHYLNSFTKKAFAGRYNAFYLVYCETYKYVNDAIAREKEIKGWRRQKKEALINSTNPGWRFLNDEQCDGWPPANPVHRCQDQESPAAS
jgi:putative endonuclease